MPQKKYCVIIFTVLILLAAPSRALDIQEPAKSTISFPFLSIEGWVVLPVSINGSREMNMILDTGMPLGGALLLRPELGEEIGLDYTGQRALGGAGSEGIKYGNISTGIDISIQGLNLSNQPIITLREALNTITPAVDGVIGKILFGSYVVEIDFELSLVTLHEFSTYTTQANGKELPLFLRNGLPFLLTSLSLDGKDSVPVTLVVDMGARHALSLYENSEKNIFCPQNSKEGIIGSGMLGDVVGSWGRISQLELKSFKLRGLITTFPKAGENMGIPRSMCDGNLGIQSLRRFNIVFDYSRKRLILTPNGSYSKPFEFNMAGLLLRRHFDGNQLVYDVLPGSPGERQGIQKGDIILSINGRKTAHYAYDKIVEIFEQDGKKLTLTILRQTQKIIKSVRLKRLL